MAKEKTQKTDLEKLVYAVLLVIFVAVLVWQAMDVGAKTVAEQTLMLLQAFSFLLIIYLMRRLDKLERRA
ncbi:hypothetical protein H0O03_04985 [Candidatus Micrarchaeota archaeon]|nr:hypothetical protein [Candidatus Micrarchaeota archaeon]